MGACRKRMKHTCGSSPATTSWCSADGAIGMENRRRDSSTSGVEQTAPSTPYQCIGAVPFRTFSSGGHVRSNGNTDLRYDRT